MQDTEKQGEHQADMRAEAIIFLLLGKQDPVNAKKCQKQKWQIIYKHDLSVCLEKAICSEIKKTANKTAEIGGSIAVKPIIKKNTACKNLSYGIALDNKSNGNCRKQIGKQDIRAQKSIIRKGEKIGTSSKSGEVWEKLACSVEVFAHIVCNGHMLGIPVRF